MLLPVLFSLSGYNKFAIRKGERIMKNYTYYIVKEYKDGSKDEIRETHDMDLETEKERFIMICDHCSILEKCGGPKKFTLLDENKNIINEIVFDDKFMIESFERTTKLLKELLEEDMENMKNDL